MCALCLVCAQDAVHDTLLHNVVSGVYSQSERRGESSGKEAHSSAATTNTSIINFLQTERKTSLGFKKNTKTAKDRDTIKIDLQIKKYHPTGRTSYYSNTPVSFYLYFNNSPVNFLPLFVQLYCPYS